MFRESMWMEICVVTIALFLTACAGTISRQNNEGNSPMQFKELSSADIGSRLKVTTNWEMVQQVYTTSPKGFVTFKDGVAVFDGYLRDINKNELTLVSSRDLLNRSLPDLTGAEKARLEEKTIREIERQ